MTDLAAIRYDLIAPLLQRYKRRFTLLDLGAGINPYTAQRISREFDACVVAIEQDVIADDELTKFGPRALWLRKKVNAEGLKQLACCEHFDVALALNFLHHDSQWTKAAIAIDKMAAGWIVQTPYAHDKETCGQEATAEIHRSISEIGVYVGESVQFPSHMPRPIYEMKTLWSPHYTLTMSSWTAPHDCIEAKIFSDYLEKNIEIHNADGSKPLRRYIPGLNLWNFANLGGAWPRKDVVLKLIREFPLPAEHHGDIMPHNFLFDGAELFLIDGHEGWEFDDAAGLKKTAEMVGDLLV